MSTIFSVSTFFDKRSMKKDKGSIYLLINLNRKQFYLSIRIRCTEIDYEKSKLGSRNLTEYQMQLRKEIYTYIERAEILLRSLNNPTKETFIKYFKSEVNLSNSTKVDAYKLFTLKYESLLKEERFGTAETVKCSLSSFKSFKSELFLEDINESFLKGYTNFMIKKGKSQTTVGIYLRNLKAIYNQSISDGLISGNQKPFKNIVTRTGVKSKSVLYSEQLKQLWDYRTSTEYEARCISLFFFCFLSNGMNYKDVCFLKYKNINNNVLSFVREKTKRTLRSQSEIRVYLSQPLKDIIDSCGNTDKSPDQYIFPVVESYESAKHFDDMITNSNRRINQTLIRIGKELGVYVILGLARHSFATSHKILGTPLAIISESLGHSSLNTTSHYLKQIPDSLLQNVNEHLLDF